MPDKPAHSMLPMPLANPMLLQLRATAIRNREHSMLIMPSSDRPRRQELPFMAQQLPERRRPAPQFSIRSPVRHPVILSKVPSSEQEKPKSRRSIMQAIRRTFSKQRRTAPEEQPY